MAKNANARRAPGAAGCLAQHFAAQDSAPLATGQARPCDVCGVQAAVWGPGIARCTEHFLRSSPVATAASADASPTGARSVRPGERGREAPAMTGNRQDGALRQILEQACTEAKCSANALTVLAVQNDPFRVDTPARHRDGEWLAMHAERLGLGERKIHLRGPALHAGVGRGREAGWLAIHEHRGRLDLAGHARRQGGALARLSRRSIRSSTLATLSRSSTCASRSQPCRRSRGSASGLTSRSPMPSISSRTSTSTRSGSTSPTGSCSSARRRALTTS